MQTIRKHKIISVLLRNAGKPEVYAQTLSMRLYQRKLRDLNPRQLSTVITVLKSKKKVHYGNKERW